MLDVSGIDEGWEAVGGVLDIEGGELDAHEVEYGFDEVDEDVA